MVGGWGMAAVLLIALWVRSDWWIDNASCFGTRTSFDVTLIHRQISITSCISPLAFAAEDSGMQREFRIGFIGPISAFAAATRASRIDPHDFAPG
jgi:hypothetical protein